MLLDAEETERGARALGRADYTAAIVSRGRSPWGSLIRDVRRMAERDLPHRLGRSLVDALRVR